MNFPSKSGVQVAARLLLHGRFQVLKDAERMRQDMLARLVQVAAAKECDNQLNSCSATQADFGYGGLSLAIRVQGVSKVRLTPVSALSATARATRALIMYPPCRTRARAGWFAGAYGLLIVGNRFSTIEPANSCSVEPTTCELLFYRTGELLFCRTCRKATQRRG